MTKALYNTSMVLLVKFQDRTLIRMLSFGIIAVIELLLVNEISDLRPSLSSWEPKANSILNLDIPTDNYYGPGAAILLIPFLWNDPLFFVANLFYVFIGSICYYLLCQRIKNLRLRITSYCFLLLNPYFFWLCHSSQDTVLEFALLMISINLGLRNKFALFFLTTFLLAETRSQYWLFIFTALFLRIWLDIKLRQKLKVSYFLPVIFFFTVSIFNSINYGSSSITWYAGETFELGQSKYMYLVHPKFDADHLLGLADTPNTYRDSRAPEFMSPAEKNDFYLNQGLDSILDNPKQFVLNIMQKVDSYIFSTQKVPSSPGYFSFDHKSNSIKIIDERLNWSIILGNFVYQVWRAVLLILLIASITLLITSRQKGRNDLLEVGEHLLVLPWISTFLVILLFYMETRYKVIPELLVPIYVLIIFDRASNNTLVSRKALPA